MNDKKTNKYKLFARVMRCHDGHSYPQPRKDLKTQKSCPGWSYNCICNVYAMYMWACTFCIVMWLWWALSCGINCIHGFIKSVWDIRPKNPLVRTLLWNFRNNLELVQLYLAKPNMLNYTCLIVPEILETGVPQGTILDPLLSMTFWNLFMLSD